MEDKESERISKRTAELLAFADWVSSDSYDKIVISWSGVIFELKDIANRHGYKVVLTNHKAHIQRSVTRDGNEMKKITYRGSNERVQAIILAHEVGHLLMGHQDNNIRPTSHRQREYEAWEKAKELLLDIRGEIPMEFPKDY